MPIAHSIFYAAVKTSHYPNPRHAGLGIPLAHKPMRSIFLMEETSRFGEKGRGDVSPIGPGMYGCSGFSCVVPRRLVRGACGVIFHSRTAGDRHD